ncbi:MAG: hypothetical protein ACI9KE_002891, partial [Polyangiales bacterium]
MLRLVPLLLLASACSVDHAGLQQPTGVDTGPAIDGAAPDARDSGVDALTLDAPPLVDARPDVRMSDGGPDVPLPVSCEVYVSRGGNDSNDGLTPSTSLRNIQTALDLNPSVVCVAQGDFDAELTIASSVRLRGSFCGEEFLTQSTDDCLSRIRSALPWAILVHGGARLNVEIEVFRIETGNADANGGSTYGVRVIDSDLTLTDVSILSKDGSDGANGTAGTTGAVGDGGGDGEVFGGPGSGGRNCRRGGDGGGLLPFGGPQPGDDGADASGEWGQGGDVGANAGDTGANGADAPAEPAAPGPGGSGNGFLSPECLYIPMPGAPGATGMPGFGGGGGGAASDNFGRFGGGGGGGGCGGSGGG